MISVEATKPTATATLMVANQLSSSRPAAAPKDITMSPNSELFDMAAPARTEVRARKRMRCMRAT